jgi:guanylate kinase
MNNIELLILHGPPGAGKTSIASTMAKLLRDYDVKHTVIDMDYLAKIYPLNLIGIMYKNLAAIWPNYVELGDIKVIMPTYLQKGELEIVMSAAPAMKTIVCEVTAPAAELKRRISIRETDDAQRERHLNYLYDYSNNGPKKEQIDFQVINHNITEERAADDIIKRVGWA